MYSGRESKGVGDKLFTTIRDHWDKKVAGHIDYQNICLFDWGQGQSEYLDQKATESLAFG